MKGVSFYMHNYIAELKKRLESESDEHRKFQLQAQIVKMELFHKERIRYTKSINLRKKGDNCDMSKITTVTQYAVFAKRTNGDWIKLNGLFYYKSKAEAERHINDHKNSFEGHHFPCEYKIMSREVTTITEDWADVL